MPLLSYYRWHALAICNIFLAERHASNRISVCKLVNDLGVKTHNMFDLSAQCFEFANKTAFTPFYCALVRPHLEYTMEANALQHG